MQIFEGSSHVNVSHVIHDLSFGPKYPGIHNPLDETSRILHDTSGTFKYYIKVSSPSSSSLAFVIKHVLEVACQLQH
uniref:Endoplasmic reticulum vesicle transporter C-terminal domain-containing protein n=1 Tax=Arundo donax TaxID=35708 RepID=A0A0A9DZ07_ARUDO